MGWVWCPLCSMVRDTTSFNSQGHDVSSNILGILVGRNGTDIILFISWDRDNCVFFGTELTK
jgi:hypothetical protein